MRRAVVQLIAFWCWALTVGCGIRGPPRPAPPPPTIPSSLRQEENGRDFPSRAPLESSGTPPVLQTPVPPAPLHELPDGGLDPFHP